MANDLTGSGSLGVLSNQLIQLVESHAATASQVFTNIETTAQVAGSFSAPLAVLLAGMAGTTDTALQAAVGQEFGRLVAGGSITGVAAVGDLNAAVAAGQVTGAQFQAAILASLSTGGLPMQAAVGLQLGGTQLPAFIAAQSGGTISVTQLVGILTGMGTVAYAAPNGGSTAAAAGIAQLVITGQQTLSQSG